MKRHRILFVLSALLFTSCATVINSKTSLSTVFVNEPAEVSVNDEIHPKSTEQILRLKRSRDPVTITITGDSLSKEIDVKPTTSAVAWLNMYFWPLFLVDFMTEKIYSYPRRIYVDMQTDRPGYVTYKIPEPHQNNILKITPLKLVGLVNPSVEISYERRTSDRFASQLMFSPLLPQYAFDVRQEFNTQNRGFRTAIEERWYFKNSAPANRYLALEVDYLKNRYRAMGWFADNTTDPDVPLQYLDTFNVKKFTLGFAFKFGFQKIINRFLIDYYVGLGAKYREATHYNRRKPEDLMAGPRHPNVWHETNRDGSFWTVLFPMNIRVGWLF